MARQSSVTTGSRGDITELRCFDIPSGIAARGQRFEMRLTASRANVAGGDRASTFVYVDEFQSFTTLAVAEMLAELRKYGVGFTMAHQYLHQLDPLVRHAILGNAGSLVSFRVGAEDASVVSRELDGIFSESDLIRLPNRSMAVRLMIDGEPSRAFSAATTSVGRA